MEWSLRIGTSAAGNYFEGGVACAAARRRPPRPARDHTQDPTRPACYRDPENFLKLLVLFRFVWRNCLL